jgi:hypothetical protein
LSARCGQTPSSSAVCAMSWLRFGQMRNGR